jgi:hypothetical protein
VAFKVGREAGINYLTMQVHYKNVDSFKPPRKCRCALEYLFIYLYFIF